MWKLWIVGVVIFLLGWMFCYLNNHVFNSWQESALLRGLAVLFLLSGMIILILICPMWYAAKKLLVDDAETVSYESVVETEFTANEGL